MSVKHKKTFAEQKKLFTESFSGHLELPQQLEDMLKKDPKKAKIFISKLDGFCLVVFPLLYVIGLVLIYFMVE